MFLLFFLIHQTSLHLMVLQIKPLYLTIAQTGLDCSYMVLHAFENKAKTKAKLIR